MIVVPARRAMPDPIASVYELAEELAELARHRPSELALDASPITQERVLEALVRFAYADRADLRDGLTPVLPQVRRVPGFADVVAAALGPVHGAGRFTEDLKIALRVSQVYSTVAPPLTRLFECRLCEIAMALTFRPVPALVATPTEVTGRLDPQVLLGRLERAAQGSWDPLRYDLEQAFLRLPSDLDPVLAKRAEVLDSAAGHWLASWLRTGGLPRSSVARVGPLVNLPGWGKSTPADENMILATVTPGGATVEVPESLDWPFGDIPRVSSLPPSLVPLAVDLPMPGHRINLTPSQYVNPDVLPRWPSGWPLALPGDPDVIAAHLVRYMPHDVPGIAEVLPSLADADGAFGPGMTLALAYGLGGARPAARVAATDAFLVLAARGRLDGAALGVELGALTLLGKVRLDRFVAALRDATNGGASGEVWEAVAGMLPALLAAAKLPNRFVDLIALGFEAAEASGARGEIPALAGFAASKRRSQAATEARRLHGYLLRGR